MSVNGTSKIYPFEMPKAVQIISQMATDMKYLHDKGVVHGDSKPKNVLMCLEPSEENVKVVDFRLVETKKWIKLVSINLYILWQPVWAPSTYETLEPLLW